MPRHFSEIPEYFLTTTPPYERWWRNEKGLFFFVLGIFMQSDYRPRVERSCGFQRRHSNVKSSRFIGVATY